MNGKILWLFFVFIPFTTLPLKDTWADYLLIHQSLKNLIQILYCFMPLNVKIIFNLESYPREPGACVSQGFTRL